MKPETIKLSFEMASLFLGLVNGVCLLYFYRRDKAKFVVSPIHPDIYQWWFELPDGMNDGSETKCYGFVAYIGVSNKGLRNAALNKWRLSLPIGKRFKKFELRPMNLPEPQFKTEGFTKSMPILGQVTSWHNGEVMVNSGASISGMTYFVYQYYGNPSWGPKIINNKITAKIKVKNVFGQSISKKIIFAKKETSWIEESFPNITKYGNESQQDGI